MVQESILKDLTINGVQELIEQERLIRNGSLKIHYAIDHHEVSEYCFPLGFQASDFVNLNQGEMVDRQTTLRHLFQKHRVIFLEEYITELDRLYDHVNFIVRNHIDNEVNLLLSHLSERNQGFSVSSEEYQKKNRSLLYLESKVSEHLPLLLAICFGFAEKGIEKLQYLDNKRLLFGYDDIKAHMQTKTGTDAWPAYIADFVKQSKPGELADELFDEYNELNRDFNEDGNTLQYVRKVQNLRTDCGAIARVITINKLLYQEYQKQKKAKGKQAEWHFIQFISSDDIFKHISETNVYKKNLISEGGIKLNPFKSLEQRYLWMLCDDPDKNRENNRGEELTNYLDYMETEKQKQEVIESIWGVSKNPRDDRGAIRKPSEGYLKLNNKFDNRIEEVRKSYEKTGLLFNYVDTIDDSVNNPINQLLKRFQNFARNPANSSGDTRSVETRKLCEDLLNLINHNLDDVHNNIKSLRQYKRWHSNELRSESSFQNRLLKGLLDLEKQLDRKQDLFMIHRGKDKVQGAFQHLPIAFNVSSIYKGTLEKSIASFLVSSLDKIRIRNLINYLLDPNDNLMSDKGKVEKQTGGLVRHKPAYEGKLIRSIVLLLMPKLGPDDLPELDLYYWVTQILERLENDVEQNLTKEQNDAKPNSTLGSNKSVQIEFYYLATWLARRLKNYKESAQFAEKGSQCRPTDIRFIHGKCLVAYCQALDKIEEAEQFNEEILSEIVANLTSCSHLALDALTLLNSPDYREFIIPVKSYLKASLQNTTSYVNILLAEYDSDQAEVYLNVANDYLEQLKKFVIAPDSSPRYNAYPEFLHTEASYCLERAKRATQPNEFAGFKEKGLSAINAALNLRKNLPKSLDSDSINKPDIYEELCQKLEALDWANAPQTSTSTVVPSPE